MEPSTTVPDAARDLGRLPVRRAGAQAHDYKLLPSQIAMDADFVAKLESLPMEAVVEYKISRFLDQLGSLEADDLYTLMLSHLERPLLAQILRRTGGNQVHAAKILGINRNTLRKKMKQHSLR